MKSWPLVGAVFAVWGCGSVKEFVPIRPAAVQMHMPNQQRLIAISTTEAIRGATLDPKLNLTQYKGLKGRVEVNGVFPPSDSELLDYVATAVEGEMMQAGIAVLPRHQQLSMRLEGPGGSATAVAPENADQKPDVRVVASLDWGGVDYEEQQGIIGSRVGLCIFLSIFTAGIGGIIYGLLVDFHEHIFTLKSRVHLTLRALPTTADRKGGVGVGEGESKIVIDARSSSGYTNELTVPTKDGK